MSKQKPKPLTESRLIAAAKAVGVEPEKLERLSVEYRKQYLPEPTVKVKPLNDGWVTGYAAIFTDATKRDKSGTWFDYGRTNFMLSNYKQLPIFQTHGKEGVKERIGIVSGLETRDAGLLVTRARFDLLKPLARQAWANACKGQLYFSGGALPEFALSEPDGCLTLFALCELSVTRTPSGPTYKADHYSRDAVLKDRNRAYKSDVWAALLTYGLPSDAVVEIVKLLPEPFKD